MSDQMAALETRWQEAVEREDVGQVESLVREILQQHPDSALASQIRYQRGVLALMEGEGHGSERLAKAMSEFGLGSKAGEAAGDASEPWRSLNLAQLGACKARLGNIEEASRDLQAVAAYRPRTVAGIGALGTLARVLRDNDREREASRFDTQRISYARGLVRDNKDADPATLHELRFVLAQELLDSNYASEGVEILQELKALGATGLGEEMYADVLGVLEQVGASSS
ncbi:MAG: hypothetical protein H6728_12295 [Myxococcales bacterium]|nr:hypothetical protein [Myxococcales bacterium]MCB9643846.1 hypothetical protein [Myxococcales bacterium]